jgi:SulP family sulfate permease
MVAFARRVAHFVTVERTITTVANSSIAGGATADRASSDTTGADAAVAHYVVTGELFFASSNDLTTQFEYADDPAIVTIDMTGSHVWDASTVAALDAVTTKYAKHGKTATIVGMNDASTTMHTRLAGNLGAGH